jgi:hypothetical protein
MKKTEIKSRFDKFNPPGYGLFKGYEPGLPTKREPSKVIFRPPGYDFVVDWQMNDRSFKGKPVK